MTGILVYRFPEGTSPLERNRFLIALGKVFSKYQVFTEDSIIFKVDHTLI